MLRRAVEVAAITVVVAIVAGTFALLELGATRAIPGITGAAVASGLVFLRRERRYALSAVAALCSLAFAFAVDWFVLFVLGAGYPELKELRRGPYYQALLVVSFGVIAAFDARGSPTPSDAHAARS